MCFTCYCGFLSVALSFSAVWGKLPMRVSVCVFVCLCVISAYLTSSWVINILDINTKFLCGLLMDPKCICSWPSSCTHICVDPRWQCWDLLCANTMHCWLYTLSGVNSLNGQCALARVVCWTVLVLLVLTVCSHIVHTLKVQLCSETKVSCSAVFSGDLERSDSANVPCHCNTVQRRSRVI